MPICQPYKFSDWYGYDKDCVTLTAFLHGNPSAFTADMCNQLSSQGTYYHDGSGTYPVTGGVFTLALTVTDTDTPANSTGQVCNIAGLVPDKDTFFNFWFDLSGSMDDIVNTIASNSSLARVYSQSDTGGTGTGTSTGTSSIFTPENFLVTAPLFVLIDTK